MGAERGRGRTRKSVSASNTGKNGPSYIKKCDNRPPSQLPPAQKVLIHLAEGRPASLQAISLGLPGWGSGPLLISNDSPAPPRLPLGFCVRNVFPRCRSS